MSESSDDSEDQGRCPNCVRTRYDEPNSDGSTCYKCGQFYCYLHRDNLGKVINSKCPKCWQAEFAVNQQFRNFEKMTHGSKESGLGANCKKGYHEVPAKMLASALIDCLNINGINCLKNHDHSIFRDEEAKGEKKIASVQDSYYSLLKNFRNIEKINNE